MTIARALSGGRLEGRQKGGAGGKLHLRLRNVLIIAQPVCMCVVSRVYVCACTYKNNCRDVHHCKGTDEIFAEDPNVLVISLHRYGR